MANLLRHLPFAGHCGPDADPDDAADEPNDLDATPLAPRDADDCRGNESPVLMGQGAPVAVMPMRIHAPRGRQASYPGYTPYAVVMSAPDEYGDRDIVSAVALVRERCLNVEDAETVAVFNTHDQSEIRKVLPDATHVIVNDHNGWTLRTYPLD